MNFEVPTYSALCKSRKRISPTLFKKLLEITAEFKHNSVAVDSTGFARTNPSYHYIKRIATKKPIKNFVKLSAFFDLSSKKFTILKKDFIGELKIIRAIFMLGYELDLTEM